MSDEFLFPEEDGVTQDIVAEMALPSACSQFGLQSDVEIWADRLTQCEDVLEKLRETVDQLQDKHSLIVAEVVGPITSIVNSKFGAHEEEIMKLRAVNERYDTQIERCLDLVESCSSTLKAGSDHVPGQIHSKSKRRGR